MKLNINSYEIILYLLRRFVSLIYDLQYSAVFDPRRSGYQDNDLLQRMSVELQMVLQSGEPVI